MAKVVYNKMIDTVRGAIDSVKEGQAKRERTISRWHDYGERSYTKDGRKIHEVYKYKFHEGAWSEGATRNRELIKQAQRMAHDIEYVVLHPDKVAPDIRDEGERMKQRYELYCQSPEYSVKRYHFYNYIYVNILRSIRGESK